MYCPAVLALSLEMLGQGLSQIQSLLMYRWEAVGPLYLKAMDVLYRVRNIECHCFLVQYEQPWPCDVTLCMLCAGQPNHAVLHPGFWADQLWAELLRNVLGRW